MTRFLKIGTRGSQLALWQATEVSNRLMEQGIRSSVHVIRTTGDKRQDVSLASIGGKGLFIKELEESLAKGETDIAVHSLKDVPSEIPATFQLGAFLERADPRDVWIQREGRSPAELPVMAVVGTSSPRRRVQLRARHPHLFVEDIRGNVDTRIGKVHAGLYAATLLAAAGLVRLGRASEVTSYFSVEEMIPAAGQGIIAVEMRAEDHEAGQMLSGINHERSALAAICERGVLQKFQETIDCYSPIAVHATVEDDELHIRAFAANPDGTKSLSVERKGATTDGTLLVAAVASELMDRGAVELLRREVSR